MPCGIHRGMDALGHSPAAQAFSCQLSVTMETRRLCEFQLSPLSTTESERSERIDNYFLIYVTLAKTIGLPKFYFFSSL